MTVPRQAIILAAGHGTRLAPLTDRRPKPLVPFLNVPLLEHGLIRLRRAGVRRVAINAFHLGAQIADFVSQRGVDDLDLHVEIEQELLGTGGGLKNLRGWIEDGPLLLLAGDVLATDFDLAALARRHAAMGALATMALVTAADIRRYGAVDVDDDGNITDIVSTLGRPGTTQAVNGSAHVLESAFVDRLPAGVSCLVRQGYLPALSDGKRIAAWFHDRPWTELGTQHDLLAAQGDALSGVLPVDDEIWAAAGRRDGVRSVVHPSAEVADNARLYAGTVVGAGARVGPRAVLKRCLLLPGAVVAPATRLDHCVVDNPSVRQDIAP